jgi:hypothetical protein
VNTSSLEIGELEKEINKITGKNTEPLLLPVDIPDDLQKFYEDLGCPFFNSETKEQIKKLSKLQMDVWNLHKKHRRLLILKSQKIGISSVCIVITLWHALKDCTGMELIINAQSDEQAKTHGQDLRRILLGSDKYRNYLVVKEFPGLMKDEVTNVHNIWLHNPKNPRQPTKIKVIGMSPGALLSHKKVAFIWSSDITISNDTPQTQNLVWGAMISRLANSQGPMIVECPAKKPEGPVFDTYERFEKKKANGAKIDPKHDFYVEKFTYKRGLEDGFFDEDFVVHEKERMGPVFGAFYAADFFSSSAVWYEEEHFANQTDRATEIFLSFNGSDDKISNLEDD